MMLVIFVFYLLLLNLDKFDCCATPQMNIDSKHNRTLVPWQVIIDSYTSCHDTSINKKCFIIYKSLKCWCGVKCTYICFINALFRTDVQKGGTSS